MAEVDDEAAPTEAWLPAAGVFRKLVHIVVPERAYVFNWSGILLRFAECGSVAMPTLSPEPNWDYCPECWDLSTPGGEPADKPTE